MLLDFIADNSHSYTTESLFSGLMFVDMDSIAAAKRFNDVNCDSPRAVLNL